MSAIEINALPCEAKGDVVSWETLKEQGTAPRRTLAVPYCHGKVIHNFKAREYKKAIVN